MSLIDKFRPLDDFLFDRIFQPATDFAAMFGRKSKQLGAAGFMTAGSICFLLEGPTFKGLFGLFGNIIITYLVLYVDEPNRSQHILGRLINIMLTVVNGISGLDALIIFSIMDCGLYFSTCQDKPPKRRWWKKLKRAIDSLAWTPKLGIIK